MKFLRTVALATSLCVLSGAAFSFQLTDPYDQSKRKKKKKKKKNEEEPPTQVLELPPDPPSAVVAETQRLVFEVAPLSAKGLLSQQVRDALKALFRMTKGDQIVKLRAFVAGTGDLRRVSAIVSETFAERRMRLPVLSVIQVGALPMEGAQVALESISMDKKAVNPQGLAFISGQQTVAEQPTSEMAPLIQTSLAGLKTAVASLSVPKDEVLQVTCFATSLSDYTKVSRAVTEEFPRAVTVIVQPQRLPGRSLTECEAVARLGQPVGAPVKMVNPSGMTKSEAYSQIALIGAERVALSGTQLAFRLQEEDARLAFQRLDRSLEGVKTSLKRAAVGHFYALSQKSIEMIRSVRFDYLDKDRPPASTLLLFEGLPSLDASFGLDVIAIVD